MTPPSKNGPCPCGSGKKYKLCCLSRDTTPCDACGAPATSADVCDIPGCIWTVATCPLHRTDVETVKQGHRIRTHFDLFPGAVHDIASSRDATRAYEQAETQLPGKFTALLVAVHAERERLQAAGALPKETPHEVLFQTTPVALADGRILHYSKSDFPTATTIDGAVYLSRDKHPLHIIASVELLPDGTRSRHVSLSYDPVPGTKRRLITDADAMLVATAFFPFPERTKRRGGVENPAVIHIIELPEARQENHPQEN